ncbi:MAG: XRE family transcriptional regulator [Ruminococcaceae bacterium]|nr:XRE family transcriptional regulator [Oscillospiraceae bacterium]
MAQKENIYKEARRRIVEKNSASASPAERAGAHELSSLERAQDVLMIERSRLSQIENSHVAPYPDEVVAMAKAYRAPELCNHYCAHQCPIGEYTPTPELLYGDLNEISVRLMSSLHFLQESAPLIYKVLEDGKVNPDEREAFSKITDTLRKLSYSAASLELWARKNGLGDGE